MRSLSDETCRAREGRREERGRERKGEEEAAGRWHAWNLEKSPPFVSVAVVVVACKAQKVAKANAQSGIRY